MFGRSTEKLILLQSSTNIRYFLDRIIKAREAASRSCSNMSDPAKRPLEQDEEGPEPKPKTFKIDLSDKVAELANLTHGKGRPVPTRVLEKLSAEEIELLLNVKSSCVDLERIKVAVKLRMKYRLNMRLPEDMEDTSYYIEDGLRKVYPYPYVYQCYARDRWAGRRLGHVLKNEFRDISDEQMRLRFELKRVLVNGEIASYDHIIRQNDFLCNLTHRHELPVLASPIKVIHSDKDTLVIDKPPSLPIHTCGRYRHNSVVNLLKKEYKYDNIKVVHRLDRLVSGILIIARNTTRAHILENMISNRDVQKEYVCRVEGEFPLGKEDEEIVVDQPLEILPSKISITVVHPKGKPSMTTFKRLNYNGKTSAVLCRPKTGRMHQIRVHLQYLGHPIVNDSMYNSTVFGPTKGKGGEYGKSLAQLSKDMISQHRSDSWLVAEASDIVDSAQDEPVQPQNQNVVAKFISNEEKEETMAAIKHFFTDESWKELEEKHQFDPDKLVTDVLCRDCGTEYFDPPPRRLFLYLHALRYSGKDWSYESEMPAWAKDDWKY